MSIKICQIGKKFGPFTALQNINLQVNKGELVSLIGPSGSGKTTLLRIIAGLDVPDEGVILIDDEDATSRHARERRVGFVFQHYALFRHMSVFDNIAFGLNVRPRHLRPSKSQIRDKVLSLLKLVQLEGLAQRFPSQLSGGQRQRIALARSLAIEPAVLLLDEPFGALDAQVRKELRRWLRRLHDEMQMTTLFVTHDQEEALEVSDRVVIMHDGKIEQIGSPEEVYDHPANPFVYHFLGNVNLFRGRVQEGKLAVGDLKLEIPDPSKISDQESVLGYARPHEMEVFKQKIDQNLISAKIQNIVSIGPLVRLELICAEDTQPLQIEITKEKFQQLNLNRGENVFVTPKKLRIF